jgi:lipoate-protein ligase A
LKNLEQEYENEQSNRKNINDKLESEGYKTMKEKMDALHEKALSMEKVANDLAEAASENFDINKK